MFYFKKAEDGVHKYEVSFDKNEVSLLLEEVKSKCSTIKHFEYDDVNLPSLSERIYSQNQSDESEIRFFSQKLVGYREYNDFYSPVEDVYHYSYYEYTYSPLVSIINGLLNDSPMVIDKIFNPENIHRFNFDHEIDNINNEINKIPNNKIKEKMDKLNELNDLLKFANLNSKQKDEDEYYIADLLGMKVLLEDGSEFGTLKNVMETGANDVYIVDSVEHGEVLLPAIKECILDVDIETNTMTVHLMKGLL